jgi:hypothetical protein
MNLMNMFTVLRKAFQTSVPLALLFLLAVPSFAQTSLRRALDYDGDGKADFSVYRPTNNVWYSLRSLNQSFTSTQFGVATTDTPSPGDYDGDGKGDVCIWRDTDGIFYYLRSSNGTVGAQQFGISGDEPVARQWDGDAAGRTDFAVVRRFNNQLVWYILTNPATGAGTFSSVQFGLASDYTIPGDYDGDGKFDYAVQRPTSATPNTPANIYIQQTTAGFRQLQYGYGSDFFAPGDYDGDGKTDLCAVRDNGTNLTWYILNSLNNNLNAVQFGTPSTDFLAQNDYDGDGKTDVAVWRDSTGVFYSLGSLGVFQAVQFGSSGDVPIASYDTH